MNKGPGRKRIQFTDEQLGFASSAPAKEMTMAALHRRMKKLFSLNVGYDLFVTMLKERGLR